MIAGRSATLLLILLSVCVLLVSAEQRIFTRHTGMNVTLEFPVPNGTTSIWLKRPGSDKYIFYCRDGHPTLATYQEPSFKSRVDVVDCGRINGTVSVTVRTLTPSDSGQYEFHWGKNDDFNETIFLDVADPGQRGGHEEDGGSVGLIVGLSVSAGILVGVGVGLWIYRRCRKPHGPDPKQLPDEQQLDCESLESHDRDLHTCEEKLLMKAVP